MKIEFSGFNWDTGNLSKCQKHGVSCTDIEQFFISDRILVAPDIKHSDSEERFIAIGKSSSRMQHILVIFTLREHDGETLIRPISARCMHEKEIRNYEKTLAEVKE